MYQPLLIAKNDGIRSEPVGLKESEVEFVTLLRTYYEAEKDASLKDAEIYLLRNLSRGTGIGFFGDSGFYPDFILWLKQGGSQRIVFVEPHGLLMEDHLPEAEKVLLFERACADIS